MYKMNQNMIKLNARGINMYVGYIILAKSPYFENLLSCDNFKSSIPDEEDGSYYVDCNHDVMVEIIAVLETGFYKYDKINPNYMREILNKYCIDFENKEQNNLCANKLNDAIEKINEEIKKRSVEPDTRTIGLNYNKKITSINICMIESFKDENSISFTSCCNNTVNKLIFTVLCNRKKINLSDYGTIEFIQNHLIYLLDKYDLNHMYCITSVTKKIGHLSIKIDSFLNIN